MAAQDLVVRAEAKTFLKILGATDDARIDAVITRASDWIEQLTQRSLAERAFTNLRLTGPDGAKFYPPAWPINTAQTITIKLDESAQTVWKTETDGDVDDKDVVVASDNPWDGRWGLRNHFYRRFGWASALGFYWLGSRRPSDGPAGQNRLLLSYTGGYASVPEDLKQACLYLVQKLWRDHDKQLTGVTSLATPTSVALPEPWMPREVLALVDPYRRSRAPGLAFAAT